MAALGSARSRARGARGALETTAAQAQAARRGRMTHVQQRCTWKTPTLSCLGMAIPYHTMYISLWTRASAQGLMSRRRTTPMGRALKSRSRTTLTARYRTETVLKPCYAAAVPSYFTVLRCCCAVRRATLLLCRASCYALQTARVYVCTCTRVVHTPTCLHIRVPA